MNERQIMRFAMNNTRTKSMYKLYKNISMQLIFFQIDFHKLKVIFDDFRCYDCCDFESI